MQCFDFAADKGGNDFPATTFLFCFVTHDCDGYPFPYTCATIDEARAIYAACIKAASEPWERKETEETQ